MRFQSKPSVIEAVQWGGEYTDEIRLGFPGKVRIGPSGLELLAGKDGAQEWVPVPIGHWLVHQPDDLTDIWPVEDSYFCTKYEIVS